MQESTQVAKDVMDVHRLFERGAQLHKARFGRDAQLCVAAPGRVNLIGEHTDYNDGFVFPMAIERHVAIVASRPSAKSSLLRVHSDSVDALVEVPLDSKPQRATPRWANYVRGIVAGFHDRGYGLDGLDLTITSSVPLGSGLSSSAALEVAVASTLEASHDIRLEPLDKARLCQTAEHEYALVPCGLMDQLASVFGRRENALFIDCRSQSTTLVPLRDADLSILVCNSNVRHSLADGEYAKRRAECHGAAEVLGKASLRDATLLEVQNAEAQLGSPKFQRARHVVSENRRTQEFRDALCSGDLMRAGELMYQSHASLRDDYTVSCQELDILVDAAQALGAASGVYGSRMTGGGFGGCTVSLVRTSHVEDIICSLVDRYRATTGKRLDAFVTRPSEGMVYWA
jgi:galactokinase